jgi:competence protein ComEC
MPTLPPARVRAFALVDDFRRDLAAGRGFLWWPVAFGIGAAGYFVPLDEPTMAIVTVAAAALTVLIVAAQRFRLPTFPVALLALALAGFLHADAMTRFAAHPTLVRERTAELRAIVVAVEAREHGAVRLLLKPDAIEPSPREGLPPLIRLTARGLKQSPLPGEGWQMRARLLPPSPPALPGGYDFSRVAWFAAIGATGFSLGPPQPWPDAPAPDFGLRLRAGIETVRTAIATRIRAEVPGDAGGIAAALIVGDRGGIGQEVTRAMRIAGLSHVLSISGLHMSLVAACLFGALRLALALVPPLALDWPIKKIAAALALCGTTAYFVFSGMDVPAQRSAIMVAVMLLAILIDRRALSLRVIAVAALLTLLASPQAVIDPGAEMSFAAVLALIASAEAIDRRTRDGPEDISLVARTARRAALAVVAAMATTLVAGAATAPIALYHFGRLSPLSMIANLMAAPLVSLVIMPAALVAMLAMPFGLDGGPLTVMGWGIDGMIAVADLVAGWTPGGGLWGRPPVTAMLLVVAGGIWICLWTGRKRWLGLVGVGLGMIGAMTAAPPAVIVAGDGRAVLLRNADGQPRLVGRRAGFELDVWLSAIGIEGSHRADLSAGVASDGQASVVDLDADRTLAAVITDPLAFGEECPRAVLVVSPRRAPLWCTPPLLMDGARLARTGALTFDDAGAFGRDGDASRLRETGRVYGERRRLWQAPLSALADR